MDIDEECVSPVVSDVVELKTLVVTWVEDPFVVTLVTVVSCVFTDVPPEVA